MKKVVYITAHAPLGQGETFILTEILGIKKLGTEMIIIPRDISTGLYQEKASDVLRDTLMVPWLSMEVIRKCLVYILLNPLISLNIIFQIAFNARNIKIALKNLVILPKSLYLGVHLKRQSISHVHAHWASTTSTMAYIISTVSGIPWSFTAHRWDIPENNLLETKCRSASFVRAINESARREILDIVKDADLDQKIRVVHMGVDLPNGNDMRKQSDIFTILCPANLVHVKGHHYLIESCRLLADKDMSFRCFLAGDGQLEDELRKKVDNLDLDGHITFLGRLPHEGLLDLYKRGEINAVVLPSIVDDNGEKEGTPVALMEAMAHGIPVISTNTGGIPELIGDGSGVMVEQKNPAAISDAVEKLKKDAAFYNLISELGRKKIEEHFDISTITRLLRTSFLES